MSDLDQFVEAPGRAEQVADVRRRIDAEGITYIYYQFVSVTGRIMGKGVPAKHWETMAQKGFQLVYGSTANLFVDRKGDYIGYGPEAWELVGIPEPETFAVLPWDTKVARVWCTCFRNREDLDGPGSCSRPTAAATCAASRPTSRPAPACTCAPAWSPR